MINIFKNGNLYAANVIFSKWTKLVSRAVAARQVEEIQAYDRTIVLFGLGQSIEFNYTDASDEL